MKRKRSRTTKWGKVGAPKSAKRKAWLRSIRKKSGRRSKRRR
jgi:hypothetical protein